MARVKKISKQDAFAKAKRTTPPAPFVQIPSHLEQFTDHLNTDQVYITHIDRFQADFKRRIFSVPVILNLTITLLLAWRAYAIIPTYLSIMTSVLGYSSDSTIDLPSHTKAELTRIVLWRSLNFMFDLILVSIIGPWPVSFFLERPGNPVSWRWYVWFRDAEIVVRESRKWGAEDLLEGARTGQDSPFFKTRILPAIDKRLIREKTGYLMMDKNWELDFYAMTEAHRMVDARKMDIKDFEKSVFVHDGELGWLVWEVYKLDQAGQEEESRKKIVAIKDKLTAIGKESLFFRWIEIVQYESGKPGGFGPERQRATFEILKTEFDKEGVNFEELVNEVGGLEGTPGMGGTPR